jgi:hypothetical protein
VELYNKPFIPAPYPAAAVTEQRKRAVEAREIDITEQCSQLSQQ